MRIGIDLDDTIVDTLKTLTTDYKKLHKDFKGTFLDLTEDEKREFVKTYGEEYPINLPAKDGVSDAIGELHKLGIEIYFVTARDNQYPNYQENTIKFLKKNNIPYDYIVFGAGGSKGEKCHQYNLDYMIDDMDTNLDSVVEFNIKPISIYCEYRGKSKYLQFKTWGEIKEFLKKNI